MKVAEGVVLLLVLATGVLATGVPAARALAGDQTLQPFVGSTVLDPRHDISALKRTMALSLVVQGGRQGGTIALSFAAAEELDRWHHAASSMDLQDASERSIRAHRINGTLAAVGLGVRLWGGGVSFGARRLSTALTGFTFPFLAGAALDGVAAVLGYEAGIRLRRIRLEVGVTGTGDLAHACRLSEWAHLICAVLSTFSAVSQTLVGLSGTDLAIYERHLERREYRSAMRRPVVVPVGAGLGIAGWF